MPKTYTAWKRDFIKLFAWQSSRKPLEGALRVFCEFQVATPSSYSKNERQAAMDGSRWPRADVDNLLKSVCDALTEMGVWADDSQVVDMHGVKRYGEADGIRLIVTPV